MISFLRALEESLCLTEGAVVISYGDHLSAYADRSIDIGTPAEDILWYVCARLAEQRGIDEDSWYEHNDARILTNVSAHATTGAGDVLARVLVMDVENTEDDLASYTDICVVIGNDAKSIADAIMINNAASESPATWGISNALYAVYGSSINLYYHNVS